MMRNFLIKIYLLIFSKSDQPDKFDIGTSSRFLESLKIDKDYYRMSYNQFLAFKRIHGTIKILLLDFLSFFGIPLFVIFYLLKNFFQKRSSLSNYYDLKLAYSISDFNEAIIPVSLNDEFRIINTTYSPSLNWDDLHYVFLQFKKFPFDFFFAIRNIVHLSSYSSIIRSFGCTAIITDFEYSFSSSVLTKFCEDKNVLHINVMHGLKLFYIRDSFFSFHRFYIWDSYYEQLFIDLKANIGQYIVELPPILTKFINTNANGTKFKYYLQRNETEEELVIIRDHVRKQLGLDPIFRLHPRYSDFRLLDSKSDLILENPRVINFDDSFNESRYVCSKYSTVLYQALIAKKIVVIDDLSDRNLFESLKKLRYIMNYKEHTRLSELSKYTK